MIIHDKRLHLRDWQLESLPILDHWLQPIGSGW